MFENCELEPVNLSFDGHQMGACRQPPFSGFFSIDAMGKPAENAMFFGTSFCLRFVRKNSEGNQRKSIKGKELWSWGAWNGVVLGCWGVWGEGCWGAKGCCVCAVCLI